MTSPTEFRTLAQKYERIGKDLPPWRDEDAVGDLVEYRMFLDGEDVIRRHEEAFPDGIPMNFFWPTWTETVHQALLDANIGKFEKLADLIRPRSGDDARKQRALTLPNAAWSLMADRLLRGKRAAGRPRMTAEERRVAFPVHDAAKMVEEIEGILRAYYPKRRPKEIRERAVAVAARLGDVADPEKLHNYINRGRRDRRRL